MAIDSASLVITIRAFKSSSQTLMYIYIISHHHNVILQYCNSAEQITLWIRSDMYSTNHLDHVMNEGDSYYLRKQLVYPTQTCQSKSEQLIYVTTQYANDTPIKSHPLPNAVPSPSKAYLIGSCQFNTNKGCDSIRRNITEMSHRLKQWP